MRRRILALALALALAGCATAGQDPMHGDDDDVPGADAGGPIDAPQSPSPDGSQPPIPDAFVPGVPDARPDAWAPPPIVDAAPPPPPPDAGMGAFCNMDSECAPGECCFYFGMPPGFCTPGMTIPGFGCVPM